MKILIATPLYPPDIGGPATYSKQLADELPEREMEVKVLRFSEVRHLPKVLRHVMYGVRLLALGRKADVILALDPVSVGLPAALANFFLRKKLVLKIVGDYAWEQGVQRFGVKEVLDGFLGKRYGFRVEFLRRVEKFTAGRADKIIAPSKYLKKVVEKWGVPEDKIFMIYNAFEPPKLDVSKEEARKRLGLSGKVIVSAGRDVPWKGFQALRDLMPEISRQITDTKLFILTGEPREKLLLYLRAADIFVLNTAYEGFSHQILEAMAIGVPVVSTDAGGNPELVENGVTGFLVKFSTQGGEKKRCLFSPSGGNDNAALKEKILTVLSDENLARKLSENARKKAEEFSLSRMINGTVEVLKA